MGSLLTLLLRIACIALGLSLVAGCAGTRGGAIPYDVKNFGVPDAPQAAVEQDSYKLAPLDTVTVNVFQVSDLSRDYTIDLSGNLTMPLIGSLKALGLSTTELASAIQKRLGERYLQNPDVTLVLKDSARRNITVEGSVRSPSVYPVRGPMTLVQAIATAGGASDFANPHRVAIFRQIQGKRMAAAFDLVSIRRGEAEDPNVYAGDMIIVDGSNVRSAQREILQNMPLLGLFAPFL